MAHFIIEKDVINPEKELELLQILNRNNITYSKIIVIPFIHEIEGRVPTVLENTHVILHGSIGIDGLAKRHNWYPGVFHDEEKFNQRNYVKYLGDMMLNTDLHYCSLRNAKEYATALGFETFFIKPSDDNKEFAGKVIHIDEFDGWFQKHNEMGYITKPEVEVIITRPMEIGNEWRTVVINGQISSMSLYRAYQQVYPKREFRQDIADFIMKADSIYRPHDDVYVIDVCETTEGLNIDQKYGVK